MHSSSKLEQSKWQENGYQIWVKADIKVRFLDEQNRFKSNKDASA